MAVSVADTSGAAVGARVLGDRSRLVVLSALMLFVELALIRWAGSNIVYLSYFSNFVLLGSFLGIGIGFLRARDRRDFFRLAPVALAFFVGFVRLFPVEIDRSGANVIYFGNPRTSGLPTWFMLPVIFVAVAAIMSFVAHGVARAFARFPSLEAYRLDLVGSLLGIVGFSALSFLRAPPFVWGLIVAATFVVLLVPSVRLVQVVALAAIVLILADESVEGIHSWSPYYRVSTFARGDPAAGGVVFINVNGIPHQAVESVETRGKLEPIYFLPYARARSRPADVLIVGAGNGTDVAIALSMGVRHVDAVEIDPRLYEIGREIHPDHPYQDPRVSAHIDDGRAFLERTDRRYDMILFALPDSLTLVSGQSNLRLESYLFTEEAMRTARAHLAPGGVFGMYNFYRQQWLIDRLAHTLDVVYGRAPCVDSVGSSQSHLALLTASVDPAAVACPAPPSDLRSAPPPSTDDHPFLYLRTNAIPGFYLLTIGLILAASVALIRASGTAFRSMRRYLDLFAMGVAFLLLETKNVVQFALLFGTTWFVNALVFTGVLLSVLAAVELARRVRLARPEVLYALLLVAIGVAYAVPQHALLSLQVVPRFGVATVIAFAPIFLANLVFAQRFADVGDSTTAFGANLLGAMVGGVLEYAALVTGYRALLIVVAIAYGAAFVLGRRSVAPAG
jgi:hypothetical protein